MRPDEEILCEGGGKGNLLFRKYLLMRQGGGERRERHPRKGGKNCGGDVNRRSPSRKEKGVVWKNEKRMLHKKKDSHGGGDEGTHPAARE